MIFRAVLQAVDQLIGLAKPALRGSLNRNVDASDMAAIAECHG